MAEVSAIRPMVSETRILELIPISRSSLLTWVAQGTFPKPVPIGPQRIAWFEDEVVRWQAERQAAA
jgi:prophage regulatory protein